MTAPTLSLPESTASITGNEYLRVERVVGSTVLPLRSKAGDLKVTPTGGSATALSSLATSLVNLTGDVPASSVGTVTTAATTSAVEYTLGINHVTKLTLTNFVVGTGGDNASLGIGAKFYSLPAGTILVKKATLVGGVTLDADVTTGSPEIGIGTVIASGAVSALSGTATFEDILDGNASSTGGDTTGDLTGGTIYKSSDATTRDGVVIKATGGKARDLFLNVAVAWPNSATGTRSVTFTGTIVLEWMKVD